MSGKNLDLFDLDETLFHTSAKIQVKKDDQIIKSLTNKEFNEYVLEDGEEYDFSQFRDSKFFTETSSPIRRVVDTLIERYNHNLINGGRTVVVTARADFNDREVFLMFLESFGIPVRDTDKFFIYRTGNATDDLSVAVRKKNLIRELLQEQFDVVTFFDDNIGNLVEFMHLSKEFPGTDFCSVLVNGE